MNRLRPFGEDIQESASDNCFVDLWVVPLLLSSQSQGGQSSLTLSGLPCYRSTLR